MTRKSLVPIKSRETDVLRRPSPSAFENFARPSKFKNHFSKFIIQYYDWLEPIFANFGQEINSNQETISNESLEMNLFLMKI